LKGQKGNRRTERTYREWEVRRYRDTKGLKGQIGFTANEMLGGEKTQRADREWG